MAAVGEALNLALEHHRAGRLAQAESLYRNVLRMHPAHPDALHLLGVLAHNNGLPDVAIELIGQAIAYRGTAPAFHNNLGEAYRSVGRFAEAELARIAKHSGSIRTSRRRTTTWGPCFITRRGRQRRLAATTARSSVKAIMPTRTITARARC